MTGGADTGFDLLARVEAQVRTRPETLAIDAGDVQVTYGSLGGRAAAMAQALRATGCGAGDHVTVAVKDRVSLVSVALGIWRAGGVYVPLDVEATHRNHRRLARLRSAFLVHDGGEETVSRELLPEGGGCVLLRVPGDEATELKDDALVGAATAGPAYIYFTSGSTGEPKGIVGSSSALGRRIAWEIATFEIQPGTRVSQLVTPTFDPWFRDVFVPLCAGGTLCIPPAPPARLDPERLLAWLRDARVEIAHCGPTALGALIATPARIRRLPALRAVLVAGETMHVSLAARWRRRFGRQVRLVNLYGASEATMAQFFHVVTARDLHRSFIPVGRPLPGVSVRVIDAHGRPRAAGEVGEIAIGGDALSLGYHGDAAATARAFARIEGAGDEVYYRTGDLGVEFEPDTYRLLGRIDDQVKIRGVRVEPREVEDTLTSYPLIATCAVSVRPDRHGEPSLVAYVVPETEYPPAAPEMRAYLRARLPPEYLPATFVMMKALPLSANGKIDRARLPDPGDVPVAPSQVSAPPRNTLEATLAAHWAAVLSLPAVGIHDHFLDLGGHSLSAMRLTVALLSAGVGELSLGDVFVHPTIAAQAVLLQARADAAGGVAPAPFTAASQPEPARPGPDLDGSLRPKPVVGAAPGAEFGCPRARSLVFGRRQCNLVLVLGRDSDRPSFERVARLVEELDPAIQAVVVEDGAGWDAGMRRRPTLVFSPALLRHRPRMAATVCCGYPLAKSEEYRVLEGAGIAVPRWTTLEQGKTPDLSGFGDYVVRKPDHGAKGAEVRIVRHDRVRWKPIVTSAAGPSPRLLVQEFVYTGPWPVSYRVNTLFGRVLYSMMITGNRARPALQGPGDFGRRGSGGLSVSIVSNARDSSAEFCGDADVIRLGERAARAFPELPMLGVDILKEAGGGRLLVSEVNALGHNWNFTAEFAEAFRLDIETQFDGLRKAAYVLAEETQRRAGPGDPAQ